MPVNLPPQYHKKEAELKDAKTIEEKIAVLEELISIVPKHKSSEKLQALLKSKIAKLRKEKLKEPQAARKAAMCEIDREGSGQVAICGPVNSGKSSLVSLLTKAQPEIADYPFTTKMPLPGMMKYEDIKIQLIDTPALSLDFSESWLGGLLRKSDALVFIFDISSDFLLDELEDSLKLLEKTGIKEKDGFIFKKRILWTGNKTDNTSYREVREIFLELYGDKIPDFTEISIKENKNTEGFPEKIFGLLDIIRVYTKTPGKPPDMENPYTLGNKATLMELAAHIHKDIAENFKYARLWRKGDGRIVIAGWDYTLKDGDIAEIHV
ncbi:MAG TPA: 50S ribosome-binding GTPase [bacterium]|nr:50S ribosome-binding GTPase [bacterium]